MVSAADALTTVDDLRIGLAAVRVTVALLRWSLKHRRAAASVT